MNNITSGYNKGFIFRISLVASLGGLLFGYDTAIISGVIPYIKPYFNLDEYGLGWAVGCILIGCGLGAIMAGKLMDLMGRRFVLFACAVVFALSGIGTAVSHVEWVFITCRIIGGLGVGAAAMVSPIYIAEIVPAAWRGRLVSIYQLAIVSGILIAYLANYNLADTGINNWRWMFASQTVPALAFFCMLLLVPESPRWLVGRGKDLLALKILTRVGGGTFANNELLLMRGSFSNATPVKLSTLFFGRYKKVIWLGIFIAVFQQITGINAIFYYAPIIFKETGVSSSDALLQTILIGGVNILATFIAIGLVDKVGRKRFLLIGSLLMGLALFVVASCFHYHYYSHYVILIFTLIYVATFGCTLGAVTWVYLSEIFPNRIRGFAMSVATLTLWLADFVVTYTFSIMVQKLGTASTLMVYAVCCALAAAYVFFNVPETKGRSLEEIERIFTK